MSTDDVKNFFDEFLLVEKENDRIITTSNTKTVVIPFNSNTIYVSGANIDIEHKLLIKDNIIYMPMTDLTDIYNIEIKYSSNSNIVTIDSLGFTIFSSSSYLHFIKMIIF